MTSALIPPVIPRRSAAGNRPRGTPAVVRTLPLPASPGQAPALAADVVYGLGRIDASGRVADRTVTRALGWHGIVYAPGTDLRLALEKFGVRV